MQAVFLWRPVLPGYFRIAPARAPRPHQARQAITKNTTVQNASSSPLLGNAYRTCQIAICFVPKFRDTSNPAYRLQGKEPGREILGSIPSDFHQISFNAN